MIFTFENLPDEIIMIIFQYSGDVIDILQIFLGLNQRLNNILVDKRLHLLTNFLYTNTQNDYYNSQIFQDVSKQLSSINTTVNDEKLRQLFQPLLCFHIKQKYIEQGRELQSSLLKFNSIRQQSSNDELIKVDHQLKTKFDNLCYTSLTIETIKHLKSLILKKGARLECDNYELSSFNLSKAINGQLLNPIFDINCSSLTPTNSILDFFKTLIISNISLLSNKDYVGNGGCKVDYFILYGIYHLRYFYNSYYPSPSPINMEYYRTAVDLFLFILQGYKQMSNYNDYIQQKLFEILNMISEIHNDLYIQTVQFEIIKIIIDEYVKQEHQPWDDYLKYTFRQLLRHLIKKRRLDIIKYIYHYSEFQEYFNESDHIRECINVITRNQIERKYFYTIMNDRSFELLFSKQHLIFILLDKKERKLLEKLLKLSPDLINQLDNHGNDPLLYISLKVYGCRHRIIQILIKMGSNLQRTNFHGQNFMDILNLPRNNNLFKKLIEHQIIKN